MKFSTITMALATSAIVEAHTIFTTLWVDGKSAGDGVGVRMRKTPKTASFPISPSDDAVACGYDGEEGNPRVVSVNDGSTLSFEWRAYGSNPSKGAIDRGHKGPCAVYLKKVDSAVNDTGKNFAGYKQLASIMALTFHRRRRWMVQGLGPGLRRGQGLVVQRDAGRPR